MRRSARTLLFRIEAGSTGSQRSHSVEPSGNSTDALHLRPRCEPYVSNSHFGEHAVILPLTAERGASRKTSARASRGHHRQLPKDRRDATDGDGVSAQDASDQLAHSHAAVNPNQYMAGRRTTARSPNYSTQRRLSGE